MSASLSNYRARSRLCETPQAMCVKDERARRAPTSSRLIAADA
jgi:hypothetical protein